VASRDNVRSAYDAVAARYAEHFQHELDERPLERALVTAFAEMCAEVDGKVADVGCGFGHITRYLADQGAPAFGLDLSQGMIAEARERYPDLEFRVGDMTALGDADASWAGAIVPYSIIHLTVDERRRAFAELARVVRPGGWMMVSFHVSVADHPAGSSMHLDTWFDKAVDLTGYLLDLDEIVVELANASFELFARIERGPRGTTEVPSRRCYLIAQRK